MYIRHFLKMLFGLILMAAIGIGGLMLLNAYTPKEAPKTESKKIVVPPTAPAKTSNQTKTPTKTPAETPAKPIKK